MFTLSLPPVERDLWKPAKKLGGVAAALHGEVTPCDRFIFNSGVAMKKIVVAALALGFAGLGAQSASAADMAVKSPPPAPLATPVFSWTGFYLGAEAGYGETQTSSTRNVANTNFPVGFSETLNNSGFLGGVDAGANYQWNWLILGVEADWQGSGISGKTTAFSPINPTHFVVESRETNWIATVTGRLGVAWDRWMVYGKGGGAWREINDSATNDVFSTAGALLSAETVNSSTETGYVVGGGIEWAPSEQVSAKLEFDWYDFGTQQSAGGVCVFGGCGVGTVIPPGEITTRPTAWEIKGGINFHFNGWPVVH